VNLNVGLRHIMFEQRQPQGAGVHSVELPNGMSTRSMEQRGRNSYVNTAEAVASIRWLINHSTVHLCRDLELDHFLDLLPLVWIRFHFEARVLRRKPVNSFLREFGCSSGC
jgi:alpha-ketoglutarate-dependent taurine dioxygenase